MLILRQLHCSYLVNILVIMPYAVEYWRIANLSNSWLPHTHFPIQDR